MAVESKPLFHPEVMRQQGRAFNLPGHVPACQSKLQHWASLIASGRADEFKETALLPDFLTDTFCGLLGYPGPAATGDAYTLSRERHVEVDGKFADAVLGRFQQDKEQFVAVLEGKGTRDALDRPFGGRRMSAVDQAYRYAIIGGNCGRAPTGLTLTGPRLCIPRSLGACNGVWTQPARSVTTPRTFSPLRTCGSLPLQTLPSPGGSLGVARSMAKMRPYASLRCSSRICQSRAQRPSKGRPPKPPSAA